MSIWIDDNDDVDVDDDYYDAIYSADARVWEWVSLSAAAEKFAIRVS